MNVKYYAVLLLTAIDVLLLTLLAVRSLELALVTIVIITSGVICVLVRKDWRE